MAAGEIALRTVLAAVFAVAFVSKVRSRAAFDGFARTLDGLGLLRGRRRTAAAIVVPVVEAGLVVLLGIPGTALAGFAAALTVLAVFTGAVGRELAAGRTVRCRCFGSGAERIGTTQIVRNLVLLGCAAAGVVLATTDRGSASTWALVLAVGGALLAAAFIVRWDDLATLARTSW